MSAQIIVCPHCNKSIELTEALSHQIEEDVRKQFSKQTEDLKEELRKKGQEVEKEKRAMWEKALKMAEEKSKEKNKEEMKMLQEELDEKQKKLDEARKLELDMRREKSKLEEAKKEFELTLQRKMDEERKKIAEDVTRKVEEDHTLREREKEKIIQDLQKALEDAQRKAKQGSQQTQGEVQELALEELLHSLFPYDEIQEVAKGVRGADVLEIVHDNKGQVCGTIVWESKRTKAWSDGWVTKLKDDQRAAKANVAVLVTEVLPKSIRNFGTVQGIWVTDYASINGLVTVLRTSLIQVSAMRQSQIGKNEKVEALFSYITSTEFQQRIEAIVDSFQGMRTDLQKEKDAYQKIWAKREKQIQQVLNNTLGLHGELEGFVGKELQEIKSAELPPAQEELL